MKQNIKKYKELPFEIDKVYKTKFHRKLPMQKHTNPVSENTKKNLKPKSSTRQVSSKSVMKKKTKEGRKRERKKKGTKCKKQGKSV